MAGRCVILEDVHFGPWMLLQTTEAVPPSVSGKPIALCGPAVASEAWVWVNGSYAGHRPYQMVWSRPQELDIEVGRLLKPGASNRIDIRVLCNIDVWGAVGIYERMFLYAKKVRTPPSK